MKNFASAKTGILLAVLFTLVFAGCGDKRRFKDASNLEYKGFLKAADGQSLESIGLESGKYSLRLADDGNKIHMQSIRGAEANFVISASLSDQVVVGLETIGGEYSDEYVKKVMFSLPGHRTGKPFNMKVRIEKTVIDRRTFTKEEGCTDDRSRDVTYRLDEGVYSLTVQFYRAGVERDSTLVGTFSGRSRYFENKYEIDRSMCW